MVKRALLLVCVVAGLIGLAYPKPASAHIVATDGPIGVILHIDPFDYSVATEPQTLIFYYNDLNEQFTTGACTCRVVITTGGKTYLNKIVPPTSPSVGKLPYTFPVAGVYKISLSGTPHPATAFTPFSVSYNVRVNEDDPQTAAIYASDAGTGAANKTQGAASGDKALIYILLGLGLLLLVASIYYVYNMSKKKKGKK